jgi:hypothetical protein
MIDTIVKGPSSLFKKCDHFQTTAENWIIFQFQIVFCHGLKYLAALFLYPSNAWTFLSTQQFSQLYEV